MNSLLLKSNSSEDLDLIRQLALKLGLEATELTDEDVEDLGLLKAMEEDKSQDYVSREEVMKKLKGQ